MDILKIIQKRRSIREFQRKKDIPQVIIEKLKEALIWAPSAGNLQSRKFFFIFKKEIKEKIMKAALNQEFILQAPLVVVGCADLRIERRYGERGKSLYTICDVATAIENMMLQATSEGLGTCWVGAFDEREISVILDLPPYLRPIVIVPVGYPTKAPTPPPRVSKEEAIIPFDSNEI